MRGLAYFSSGAVNSNSSKTTGVGIAIRPQVQKQAAVWGGQVAGGPHVIPGSANGGFVLVRVRVRFRMIHDG
jgi:hypothetical protein